MRRQILQFLIIIITGYFQTAASQNTSLAKSIDTTHLSVVAILRVDSTGKVCVSASGVLIHPQVVLTAGHVNFMVAGSWPGGAVAQGFVSLANNARDPHNRVSFDWLKDVESHPDTAYFPKSFYDTSGRTNPFMFIDIGLLFLRQPIDNRPISRLPVPNVLAHRESDDLLVGAGFGYYKRQDSTFVPDSVDGLRRRWRLHNISLVNDLWLSTECDTVTNLPFMSMFDSGGPLFQGDNVVVGIWSWMGKATMPCPYSSRAIRIDNLKVLTWIKDRIKKRLGVDLN